MNFQQRHEAFVKLGEFLTQPANHVKTEETYISNRWFTVESQQQTLSAWADLLSAHKLRQWLSAYETEKQIPERTVAIIMAGNIPLVGFHDLLCVLIAGHRALIKTSSDDTVLTEWIINELIRIEPAFADKIILAEGKLDKNFDAVIATGSNNSNRYFEYYFRNKPGIFRKNRNSLAVLSGNETPEDIQRLADDIFTYFGLGCRNVSKLLLPKGFDFELLFEGLEKYKDIINHNKYANNYTYHKAIFLMNLDPHLDNGFVLLKEDEKIASPLATVFYEYYTGLDEVKAYLLQHKNELQCVVSKLQFDGAVPFGKAQYPELWDYADGIDTMKFLLEIN